MEIDLPLIYLETNVVSYLASGRIKNFLDTTDRKFQPVVSDIVLSEVSKGKPNGELEYLNLHRAWWFDSGQELIFPFSIQLNRSINTFEIDNGLTDPMIDFLAKFLQYSVGSPIGSELSGDLFKTIESMAISFEDDAKNTTDENLKKELESASQRIFNATEAIEELPTYAFHEADLRRAKIGTDFLSDITPPQIVNKIIAKIGDNYKSEVADFFLPIAPDQNICQRISVCALLLIMAGFARDSGIRNSNSNSEKSLRSSRSQLVDIQHISAAAGMYAFVTADRKCAKLAFALYEFFGLSTAVLHLRPNTNDSQIKPVGLDYWP